VTEEPIREGNGLYDWQTAYGVDETVIIGFDHRLRLSQIPPPMLAWSLELCRIRIGSLNQNPHLKNIMFWTDGNNRVGKQGFVHPQWHITSETTVYQRLLEEVGQCCDYFFIQDKQRCLLCDIMREEIKYQERLIVQTEYFLAFAPQGARYPFETWIVPRQHQAYIENGQYTLGDLQELSSLIQGLLRQLEKVLGERFLFTLVLFNAPQRMSPTAFNQPSLSNLPTDFLSRAYHWRLRLKPLLGIGTLREDATGECINPILPEIAAGMLR